MNYKVVEIKNPLKREEPGKFYAQLVSPSKIGFDELATRITATCTVTRHDCLAVLSALQEQIIFALQEGKRISLGDVGSFRLTIQGSGSTTAKEYNVSLMKRLHVCFSPSSKLKEALELTNSDIKMERIVFESEEGEDNVA